MNVTLMHVYQMAILHDFCLYVVPVTLQKRLTGQCVRIFPEEDHNHCVEISQANYFAYGLVHDRFRTWHLDEKITDSEYFNYDSNLSQYINFFHNFLDIKPACEFCGWEWRFYADNERMGQPRRNKRIPEGV